MMIPNGPAGTDAEQFPTLYPSRLRAYGAAPAHDKFRGCPAQYRAKYVTCLCGHGRELHDADGCTEPVAATPGLASDGYEQCPCERWRSAVPDIVSPNNPREFGGAVHAALFYMEEHAVGPEEALQHSWSEHLDVEQFADAVELMDNYLARGGPMAKYGTLAVEIELVAPLYVDEDFGPVYAAGILDWLGLDVNEMQVLHHVDYKSNRQPLDGDEVKRDLQMRQYDWLVRQNWSRLGLQGRPHTVAHMDGLRWNDIEVRFTDNDGLMWADWAASIARKILRDEVAPEVIGPGCRWCPRRLECTKYLELPGTHQSIAARATSTDPDVLWKWRGEAAELKKTLEDGIKDVDSLLKGIASDEGPFVIGDQRWEEVEDVTDVLDMAKLHGVLGDDVFYRIASATKKNVEQIAKDHPDQAAAILACYERLVTGRKVTRKKVKEL